MPPSVRLTHLDDWARANHGLITLAASGMSPSAWYRAIAAGQFEQIHPHVARLHGTPETAEQRIAAAVMAGGGTTAASHRSAARLWGIPRPDEDPVDVIRLRTGSRMRLDGVVVHRPSDRIDLAPQRRQNIRCTNPLRTLVDLGAVDAPSLNDALGHALSTRLVTLDSLRATIARHGRPGRHGITALRNALDSWSIDGRPADSLLETAMARLVRRHRLPRVEFHPQVEGHEVDFRVVGTNVLIECDGWLHHGLDRPGFERDRRRDAELLAAGWVVLRFTYRAITTRSAETAQRIRRVVERWQAPPDPSP